MTYNDPIKEGEAEQILPLTPEEVAEAEAERIALEAELKAAILKELALGVEKKFDERRGKRAEKERQWSEAIRLYYGSASTYGRSSATSDQPFAGDKKGDRPDFNIVRTKCDIAIAQLISMQFAGGDKNFDLMPMGPEGSSDACIAMESTISAQLSATNFGRESRRAIENRVILGVGILKGPVNTAKVYSNYEKTEGSEEWATKLSSNTKPCFVSVNPWYCFPDMSTNDPCALEDFIELHPLNRTELAKYAKHPGFNAEVIQTLLKEDPKGGTIGVYEQAAMGGGASANGTSGKYTVLEYHGPITSEELAAAGIAPSYDAVDGLTYYAEVWTCQGHILRVEISNIESYEIPYQLCPYKEDPTTVLGIGLALLVRDQQRVITQAWHMILDNSSASSGPQVVIQRGLIEPADGEWELRPRKVWHLTDLSAKVSDAFQFFVTPNVTPDLMNVLNAAKQFAEEESGVPLLMAGLQSPSVGSDSATGLGMMQQASTTLLDLLNEMWDDLINEKAIKRTYQWNMQYNPDAAIKGNYEVDVRSSSDLRNKQLYIRDMEKLSLEASQNQELGVNINMNELIRARLSMMHLPAAKIIRTAEEVAQAQQQAAQNQQPNADVLKYNIDTERLAIEKDRLRLEVDKLDFERTQNQQRELWENEERTANTYARIAEAEAQVLKSQNEKDIAVLTLASKDEQFRAKVQSDQAISSQREETKAYLAGIKATQTERDQLLVAAEQKMKRETGSGI